MKAKSKCNNSLRRNKNGGYRNLLNSCNKFNVETWNVRGISDKWKFVENMLTKKRIDLVSVTEYWLRKNQKFKESSVNSYAWLGKCAEAKKKAKRGYGGVRLLVKKDILNFVTEIQPQKDIFNEVMIWVEVKLGNIKNYFGVVYTPLSGTERCNKE
eukprot:Awhi_evm1s2643